MKIKNFILLGTLIIVVVTVLIMVISGSYLISREIESQISANVNQKLRDLDIAMSGMLRNLSQQVSNGVDGISYGSNINDTLLKMKNSTGANWAFVTIDKTNHIYPFESGASTLVANSRPWYLLALSKPQNVVENDFYSPTLESSVVTMSIAFQRNGKWYVGGLIFKEKDFFNMVTATFGNPFFVIQNSRLIYPIGIDWSQKDKAVKINDASYLVYTVNYKNTMARYGLISSMPYSLGITIPKTNIVDEILGTMIYLTLITVVIGIGELVLMLLISNKIARSVKMLDDISMSFDPGKGEVKVGERAKRIVYEFKETRSVYEKMYELFQETIAQIQELRATNEELESSYEEIEQLSNTLSKETQELKDLSDASNLISLSDNNTESIKILLDKLMRIYTCDGIIMIDMSKSENKIVASVGMKFGPSNLSQVDRELLNGNIAVIPSGTYKIMIAPIIFEAKLLGVIEMIFTEHFIDESEQDSLKRFMVGFASSLNSQRLVGEVQNSYIYLATKFAEISEIYDYETGSHIHRVGEYCALIASKLMMKNEFIKDVRTYAMIHDLGKLKVPRDILMKNGPLTNDEFKEMKKHTIYGEQLLGDEPFLEMARHIARYHHERYDGTGYPDGLSGEEIPLEARIMAIADVYDALRSPRRYKKAFTHEEAVKIMLEGDGRTKPEHFDPKILEIFRQYNLEFNRIYESLLDVEEENG